MTAISAIAGAAIATLSMLKPYMDSGPPPFPSRMELNTQVAGLTATIQGIQRQNAVQAQQDVTRDHQLAYVRQQILETLLAGAQNDYRRSPTQSGRTYICTLIGQIDQARSVNRLPPIPPC